MTCFKICQDCGTKFETTATPNAARFQSTLPHGERHLPPRYFFTCDMFQSTLPHGERLLCCV